MKHLTKSMADKYIKQMTPVTLYNQVYQETAFDCIIVKRNNWTIVTSIGQVFSLDELLVEENK